MDFSRVNSLPKETVQAFIDMGIIKASLMTNDRPTSKTVDFDKMKRDNYIKKLSTKYIAKNKPLATKKATDNGFVDEVCARLHESGKQLQHKIKR
jgi:hypothetical protein